MTRFLSLIQIVVCTGLVHAQTCDVVKAQADSLFREKQFAASTSLYDRADFFCGLGSNQTWSHYRAVAATGPYSETVRVAEKALLRHPNAAWIDSMLFSQVYLDLEQFENLAAFNRLRLIELDNQEKKQLYHSLYGVVMYRFNKTSQAIDHWKTAAAIRGKDTAYFNDLERHLKRLSARHNRAKAGILSAIIPGSGQTWNGDALDGARSLIVVGGLGYVTVRTALQLTPLEAVLGILPWFVRYYRGGIINAQEQAARKLQEKRTKKLDEVLNYLSE